LFFRKNKKVESLTSSIKYEYSNGEDRVFISYQRDSLDFVLKLSQRLEDKGVKTWYAPRNIKISGLWPEKLHEAIQNCKALLLLYTENADKSKHVMREVGIADEFNKPILWLKLDSTEPKSKILKYFLKLIQTIEYQNDEVFDILCDIFSQDKVSLDDLAGNHIQVQETTANLEIDQWSKGIYVFDTADEAAECAARVYFKMCAKRPQTTALLPTGRSAKGIFQAMLRIAGKEYDKCPFGDTYIMNDTETFGVKASHSTSRIKAINDNLIDILNLMGRGLSPSQLTYYGEADSDMDPEEIAAQNLEKHSPSVYGISVSPYMEIMGYDLGMHSDNIVNDGPRVIEINDETKEYIDAKQKTHYIYTVGLRTALSCELLMILAFDRNKSQAIERLFKEKIDCNAPITLLRNHKNAYVIITKEIAKNAGLEKYAITDLTPKEAAECIVAKK